MTHPIINLKNRSLFSYILMVELVLLFSILASFLVITAVNGKSLLPPATPSPPDYRCLFQNYSVLSGFLHLPVKTDPIDPQNPGLEIKNPFILDLFKLKTAASFMEEKKYTLAADTLLAMNSTNQHPFISLEKNKIYLKFLYSQKRYKEYIDLWNLQKPGGLEFQLPAIDCLIKTGDEETAFGLFKEVFTGHTLKTVEGYIPAQALNRFLSRFDYDYWLERFRFLARSNRFSEFTRESKYAGAPQLINLFYAEFSYNSKRYDPCKTYLESVSDEKLAPYKQRLLIKLNVRQDKYDDLREQLADFQKTAPPVLYRELLMDAAGLLLSKGETDTALNLYLTYVDHVTYAHLFIKMVFNQGSKFVIIRDSDYWKAMWLSAWLLYQKNDKAKAAVYFERGMESHIDGYRFANAYWFRRLTKSPSFDWGMYPFTYYYTRAGEIDPVDSLKPFIDLMNKPRGQGLTAVIEPLTGMVTYNLMDDAADYIRWALSGKAGELTAADKHILKMMESILYVKQQKYDRAYNRYKENFAGYQYVRLPRFLRQVVLPVKFSGDIGRYSKENGLDSELMYALIREESFFRPDALSPANALGLMQLLLRTARETAKPYGVTIKREDLLVPGINIRFGIAHFKSLVDRYKGKVYLALAAYNAGQGRVDEWLKLFGGAPEDEFIEMIPFTETRNYVKNILRNYYFYRFYYGDTKKIRK